jgi:hypothetical protein
VKATEEPRRAEPSSNRVCGSRIQEGVERIKLLAPEPSQTSGPEHEQDAQREEKNDRGEPPWRGGYEVSSKIPMRRNLL